MKVQVGSLKRGSRRPTSEGDEEDDLRRGRHEQDSDEEPAGLRLPAPHGTLLVRVVAFRALGQREQGQVG